MLIFFLNIHYFSSRMVISSNTRRLLQGNRLEPSMWACDIIAWKHLCLLCPSPKTYTIQCFGSILYFLVRLCVVSYFWSRVSSVYALCLLQFLSICCLPYILLIIIHINVVNSIPANTCLFFTYFRRFYLKTKAVYVCGFAVAN